MVNTTHRHRNLFGLDLHSILMVVVLIYGSLWGIVECHIVALLLFVFFVGLLMQLLLLEHWRVIAPRYTGYGVIALQRISWVLFALRNSRNITFRYKKIL